MGFQFRFWAPVETSPALYIANYFPCPKAFSTRPCSRGFAVLINSRLLVRPYSEIDPVMCSPFTFPRMIKSQPSEVTATSPLCYQPNYRHTLAGNWVTPFCL